MDDNNTKRLNPKVINVSEHLTAVPLPEEVGRSGNNLINVSNVSGNNTSSQT